MNSNKSLKHRKGASVDREETPTPVGEDTTLSEDELQSNEVTSGATKTRTLQRRTNSQQALSWKCTYFLLSLVVVLIAIISVIAHKLYALEAQKICDQEKQEAKEKCRLDMDRAKERHREEKEKLLRERDDTSRLWAEAIHWLIECLTGKHTSHHGNMFSTIFNALWRALKTAIGLNRDIEDCIEQFNDRYQRGLPDYMQCSLSTFKK